MAKRGTLDHPKTGRLAEALGIEPWMALGLLESVWHWAGKYAPTGHIFEKDWPQLSRTISFSRGASVLRDALIESGFIDLHYGKTFIHDWPDHADDATKKALARKGKGFDEYFKKSRICRDKIPPKSRLPEPEPEPEPEPTPQPAVGGASAAPTPPPPSPPPQVLTRAQATGEPDNGPDPLVEIQEMLIVAGLELNGWTEAPPVSTIQNCARIVHAAGGTPLEFGQFAASLVDSGRTFERGRPPWGLLVAIAKSEFAAWRAFA